jgi:hypothetical protein
MLNITALLKIASSLSLLATTIRFYCFLPGLEFIYVIIPVNLIIKENI